MARSGSPGERFSHEIDERTSLLAASSNQYGQVTIDDIPTEDEEEIDPNEFDLMLSKSQSIASGLGIEVESQETSMLRGPRKWGALHSGSRRSSVVRRRSLASIRTEEDIEEGEVESEENGSSKSPFLAGVGVTRFWLIFGGVLANYFVACFDSTVSALSVVPEQAD